MNIYLIGLMGCGKSTIGKELAKLCEVAFYDLDEAIEKRAGQSIASIFEKEGEKTFRKLEQEALLETTKMSDAIIACGGGTPCFFDNMTWINQQGLSIYLKTPISILQARLIEKNNLANRPLIRDKDQIELAQKLSNLLEKRAKDYEQAHVVFHQEKEGIPIAEILARSFFLA